MRWDRGAPLAFSSLGWTCDQNTNGNQDRRRGEGPGEAGGGGGGGETGRGRTTRVGSRALVLNSLGRRSRSGRRGRKSARQGGKACSATCSPGGARAARAERSDRSCGGGRIPSATPPRRSPPEPSSALRSSAGLLSKVFRFQSRRLGNSGQHPRSDFVGVMEGEHEIRPARPLQNLVRSRGPLRLPADPLQRRKEAFRSTGRPIGQAAT